MVKTKLTDDQLLEVARRIKDGERVADLAKEFRVSSKSIYNYLKYGAKTDGNLLEINRLKRENKALKELVGKITLDLSIEKKLL